MEPSSTSIKGRFAPSPSGRMHLGNLFSFLLAWLSARSQGGKLVLRVEDLDPVRCQPSYAWQLMEDLEWLGLDWDEGGESPSSWQSNRGHLYAAAFEKLTAMGLTYPCFCSRIQRLNEAPHIHEVSPSCPCAALTAEEAAERAKEKTPSYRIRVPREVVSFTDGLQGTYSQDLWSECGDFPIKRADGAWAYQLAVVVDDAAMGVTEVVRGAFFTRPWVCKRRNFTTSPCSWPPTAAASPSGTPTWTWAPCGGGFPPRNWWASWPSWRDSRTARSL